MIERDELLELLEQRHVPFACEYHEPVFNMAESGALNLSLAGARCKNLLLQDKLGALYLVVTTAQKSLDLSAVARTLNSKRLSFVSADRLFGLLGVRPGSLSPLALINDHARNVRLVIDEDLAHERIFLFHPLDSTATIALSRRDFEVFLHGIGHAPSWQALGARPAA
ncbi:prolyl-tRNA synthetase associated domain-containing protein [Burkholderia sp. MS455]|uniref:prolyl-tRNA synthetase associated domain-containing protein n=1 Tax=Burkholderia sp. MS455 TaxID=2811788 RepID=UPI00195B540E|nr:prolyl-tRNA synthetase associated domain-containing protein [Burkholderia sp. MS455]QRR08142.1 prolyl-tRNA synthetase associated domain-containing protein [Burkholderia sp. MS455]